MADTFERAWRPAALLFPSVPPLVVRDFVQDAYTRLCEYRGGGWSFLRKEQRMNVLAARDLTVTFVQGSTTITSAAGFVATDAGRQIKVSNFPEYTITEIASASSATIDMAYGDTGGALDATIFDGYFVAPADFKRFLVIYDPYYQRILPFWLSQDEIAISDPSRRVSDTGPRYLVAATHSPATATLGQVRYEYWPAPTSARSYPYLYYRKAERFAEADYLPGVISNRADLLKLGSQVMAAKWPGTADQKNPYYNLSLARTLQQDWDIELQRASLADDNEYPEDLQVIHWTRRYGALAPTASLLRSTDATVSDYY